MTIYDSLDAFIHLKIPKWKLIEYYVYAFIQELKLFTNSYSMTKHQQNEISAISFFHLTTRGRYWFYQMFDGLKWVNLIFALAAVNYAVMQLL